MKYTLPELPYSYSALEPFIDARTMELHYTKHHQTYVNKLNEAIEKYPEFYKEDINDLLKGTSELPEDIKSAVINHGGGHANHSFFWQILKINNEEEPQGDLRAAIDERFGSFDSFKKTFSTQAVSKFGSGWTWLIIRSNGLLDVITTSNQDSPVMDDHKILLGLDVWEHAYYLKYQNRRNEYVENYWNVVNWKKVEELFSKPDKV